jgi:hypothetical protein
MMTMMMAYYSNLMAMPLDSMAYLKNNDDNARRYYLRSAGDQLYLFTYSIFSWSLQTRFERKPLARIQ